MSTLRVAAVQMPHGPTLQDNLATARRLLDAARLQDVALALLPEYFFAAFGAEKAPVAEAVRALLADATRSSGMAVAANLIEEHGGGAENVGVVYAGGVEVLRQVKVHPMPREVQDGIVGGLELRAGDVAGLRVGMLVCADILYPEAARILALQGATVLLNPVMSPYNEVDETKEARKALYVARAYDAGAFVVKAGGFHAGQPRVVGRSLIAAPWGVLAVCKDEWREELVVADLEMDRLERFRAKQAGFPQRRPEAYGGLLGGASS